jgi:hypothetical protein
MTTDEAGEELKNVVASLNIDVSPLDADYVYSPSLNKLNKTQHIEMLIKLRTLFFDKNGDEVFGEERYKSNKYQP